MKLLYKLLITLMITINLTFFVITPFAEASKFTDLISDDGFYYTGSKEGNIIAPPDSIFTQIINALGQFFEYLIGVIALAIRGVGIGWIEIAEMLLTAILSADAGFFGVLDSAMSNYSQSVVTVDSIIFNRVELLNANIFRDVPEGDNSTVIGIIKYEVAKWYYVLRLISIAFMLVSLIFIGIKMLISTIAEEKALYKKMLVDWVVGMIIVFSIHYIMLAIFTINDSIVEALEPLSKESVQLQEEYEYGEESKVETAEMETTLYESARTRAYSLSVVNGFTGMVIYGMLVYYAWRFAIMYIIRLFNVVVLTLVAPIIAASYAINKVLTGKSKVFSGWLSEYIMNVIIQIFHVVIYTSFLSIVLVLSMESLLGIIISFAILKFMVEADKLLRQLFKMTGGKGSLTGDMENTGISEVRSAAKNLGNAVVGGQLGIKAMKATYGIATKPARVAAEAAFTKHMAKKYEKEDKEFQDEEERIQNLKEQREETEQRLNTKKQELAQEEKKYNNWVQEHYLSYLQHDEEGEEFASEQIEKYAASMKEKEDEVQKIKDEMEELDDELSTEESLRYLKNMEGRVYSGTFKGNIESLLFDPKKYIERVNGKYQKKKTRREGGADLAFWRKKSYSVGKQFSDNLKLSKILGLGANKAELKKEINFWKSNVTGVFAAIMGWPALVINPTIGCALLSKSFSAKSQFIKRALNLKNRPAYKKDKRYTYSAFGPYAQLEMRNEIEREIREAQKMLNEKKRKRHPKLARKILNNESIKYKGRIKRKVGIERYFSRPSGISTIQQEKMLAISEKAFSRRFKSELKELNELNSIFLEQEYKKKMSKEEMEQKEEAKNKTREELLFADKLTNDNVVQVGNKMFEVCQKDNFLQNEDMVIQKIEQINDNRFMPRDKQVEQIKIEIRQSRDKIIENEMAKYFVANGVTDISDVTLKDKDIVSVKMHTVKTLEDKGLIKKGEINLKDDLITTKNVKDVFEKLYTAQDNTNRILEEKMANSATVEYIARNGIRDASDLKTDEAQSGIYDIIRDRMMSDETRRSIDVIRQIKGKDKNKDKIQLSFSLRQRIRENIDSTEEVTDFENFQSAENLVNKEANRNTNKTKSKLEEAMCADTTQNLDSKKELEMLFLLSELGKKNIDASKLGAKFEPISSEMKERIEYYQRIDGSRSLKKDRDGSKKWNSSKDGSRRVIDDIMTNSIARVIHGPSHDIIDLINDVEIKNGGV